MKKLECKDTIKKILENVLESNNLYKFHTYRQNEKIVKIDKLSYNKYLKEILFNISSDFIEIYDCGDCGKSFADYESLKYHIENKHK